MPLSGTRTVYGFRQDVMGRIDASASGAAKKPAPARTQGKKTQGKKK